MSNNITENKKPLHSILDHVLTAYYLNNTEIEKSEICMIKHKRQTPWDYKYQQSTTECPNCFLSKMSEDEFIYFKDNELDHFIKNDLNINDFYSYIGIVYLVQDITINEIQEIQDFILFVKGDFPRSMRTYSIKECIECSQPTEASKTGGNLYLPCPDCWKNNYSNEMIPYPFITK